MGPPGSTIYNTKVVEECMPQTEELCLVTPGQPECGPALRMHQQEWARTTRHLAMQERSPCQGRSQTHQIPTGACGMKEALRKEGTRVGAGVSWLRHLLELTFFKKL